ncbi:Xylose isomerase-like TIM barrel [Rubripirellula tenax]|uniref:Xylose isomerase-like TIM barrel n=1 Tax=Rubripirellula tenax TaxID=2528015 RepID=A0A5C6FK89_9BACT|nr:metabolite traffic protein EboE [Rubripirellula tenax]TWU60082.1 Xylose isomerase-like TIM barrel [Rubripirellula tenax]
MNDLFRIILSQQRRIVTNIDPTKWTIGYCTNVHAGTDMKSIQQNLERFAVPARIEAGMDEIGVGLWLPATAAAQLAGQASDFAAFLGKLNLRPYTINGFPYDNFHQNVVKHAVYEPTWEDVSRLEYTQQLAEILAAILPPSDGGDGDAEAIGSISTLPIGWPTTGADGIAADPAHRWAAAGKQFRQLANYLKDLESRTGRRIVVAIEPEPGCLLDTATDIVAFFAKELPEADHRRYLTVCHDVCHSAVMMEGQADVIAQYADAGIMVGKVQVSSAVVADWQSMAIGRRREAIEQLKHFAEDRYLHQTMRLSATGQTTLTEDLPELIAKIAKDGDPVWGDDRWVVHFHVPIFLERFGHLTTTHADVLDCLRALVSNDQVQFSGHLEIETYAWSVLPEPMRKRGLAEDIASELLWLRRSIVESM